MGRNTGPVCKLCRREGAKLFLKGEKCGSAKCPFEKRSYAPGQHGQINKKRLSEFGIRLREKQKARVIYGVSERPFRKYFALASKSKGATGEKLLELLEKRLDNVLWRLTMAESRAAARQMVRSGHIRVNDRKVDIPSYSVNAGDSITVRERSADFVRKIVEKLKERPQPPWLSFDGDKLQGKVLSLPGRSDVDALIDERLIVEFYSR